jgi:hypothetical protein
MRQFPLVDLNLKRPGIIVSSAIALVVVLRLLYLATWGVGSPPIVSASTAAPRTYSTNFPLTENPISENGNWINGQTAGLDWANVRTSRGLAFGDESGKVKYDDSTALLTGPWGPDQTAQATVHSVNQNEKIYEELELRLRSSLSAHSATGYEINFRCLKTNKAYLEIVRWNGPLGSFTYIKRGVGAQYGVANGDVIKATMVGNVITVFKNDVQMLQATDDTYKSGSPGIGFYIQDTTGVNSDYGFTNFAATDGPTLTASVLSTLNQGDGNEKGNFSMFGNK